MRFKINGKQQEAEDCCGLDKIIQAKGLNCEHIVVEYNGEIISKEKWAEIVLKQDDIIEIVSFVGGG